MRNETQHFQALLLLNYETQNQSRSDSLLSVSWRYRSQQQAIDGSYRWEAQLGYGIGSQGSGLLAALSTGVYRLDLEPAGLPPDWKAAVESLAVDVIAGSYTPVMIPLIRSYTRSGVVTDTQGQAIAGARVEAIQSDRGTRRFSVTNGAGVYYLEGLLQSKYTL